MNRLRFLQICGVVFLGLAAGCSRSPEARRNMYFSQGSAFMDKHDYSRAVLAFRNAAREAPGDAEVYYRLGLAYHAARDFNLAYTCFKKATDLNPKHLQAQLRLAEILALSDNKDQLADAESKLTALVKGADADRDTLNALAFTELKLGRPVEAVEILQRALAESPGELPSAVLLAQAKLAQNDARGAEQALLDVCRHAPKSAPAQRSLAELYILQQRLPDAAASLRRALEIDPKDQQAMLDLARVQLTQGQKAEAEQLFKRLADFPEHRTVYGVFLFQDGRRDEALAEFQKVVAANPDDRPARTQLLAAFLEANRPADARKLLETALKRNPKDADALLQRAEIGLRERRLDEAENDVNRVMRMVPTSAEVHYFLAKIYQARGHSLAYRQELAKSLQLKPALLPVRLELVQAESGAGAGQAALDLLNEADEAQRKTVPWLVQRNWVLWAIGDMADLRRGIDEGLARERSLDLLVQDGLWNLQAHNAKAARTSLEEALRVNPGDLRALEALRQTYLAEKNAPAALQKVKEYAARQPKSAAVQDFLGVMLVAGGKTAEARTAFTTAKAADPGLVGADLSLVQLDVVDGKIDEARKRLQQVLAADPGNLTARRWLGNIDAMRGDQNSAISAFETALAAEPNDAESSNNLAYLLAEYRSDYDTALKYAQKAVEIAPTTPEYCDTLGWILYRKGIYSAALKYLEQAGASPQDIVWKYHLAMAYAKAGDLQRGRAVLNAALKIKPDVPEASAARELLGARK